MRPRLLGLDSVLNLNGRLYPTWLSLVALSQLSSRLGVRRHSSRPLTSTSTIRLDAAAALGNTPDHVLYTGLDRDNSPDKLTGASREAKALPPLPANCSHLALPSAPTIRRQSTTSNAVLQLSCTASKARGHHTGRSTLPRPVISPRPGRRYVNIGKQLRHAPRIASADTFCAALRVR